MENRDTFDLSLRYLSIQQLAERWGIAASTVRDILREDLPYLEFGKGRFLKRRRFHPADVVAYEERDRAGPGRLATSRVRA